MQVYVFILRLANSYQAHSCGAMKMKEPLPVIQELSI